MKPTIAVVDYGMGNLRSVQKALERAGANALVTDTAQVIRGAAGVVLPGVGAFGEAVKRLKAGRLWAPLQDTLAQNKPFLGICLGLQLLFECSEENPGLRGLGFFKGSVIRFREKSMRSLKVPHMGWNTFRRGPAKTDVWLKGLGLNDYFYFVHSYFPQPNDRQVIAATTLYGQTFCSAAAQGNCFASQFHPEKSGDQGLRLLRNFVHQVRSCS
ncbi:MAG: imidazole glycerol phosphate synthase subunit HisH [Elusimicrobiota bacterium]|jgi:glutamine amidotransferase